MVGARDEAGLAFLQIIFFLASFRMEGEDKPCGLAKVYEFVDLYSTKVLNFGCVEKLCDFLLHTEANRQPVHVHVCEPFVSVCKTEFLNTSKVHCILPLIDVS